MFTPRRAIARNWVFEKEILTATILKSLKTCMDVKVLLLKCLLLKMVNLIVRTQRKTFAVKIKYRNSSRKIYIGDFERVIGFFQ